MVEEIESTSIINKEIKPAMVAIKFQDSVNDSIWSGNYTGTGSNEKIGTYEGLRNQYISAEELWAVAKYTGKGHFITFFAVQESLKGEWKHVTQRDSDQELTNEKIELIKKTDEDFNVRDQAQMAIIIAKALGQCALVKVYENPNIKTGKMELRPAFYSLNDLVFNNGILTHVRVYLQVGLVTERFELPIEEMVLFINRPDPFGNKYIGMSSLNASYFAIKYLMNVLEAYSKIILQRGLGLLDVEVAGATSEELDLVADKWGQPSQYSALFHNERMKIKVNEGIKMGADFDQITKVYTREISSGCGIGEARLNGVQQGRVTGSETDQDNFAAIQKGIQKDYMDLVVDSYILAEPKLEKRWGIEFPIKIKFDKLKESQILATDSQTINAVQEIVSVNWARKKLGLDLITGAEGDMSVFEFITKENDRLKDLILPEQNGPFGNSTQPNSNKENIDKKKNGQLPEKNEAEIEAKKNITRTKGDTFRNEKIKIAEKLLVSDSCRVVNEILSKIYGSGLSNTDLVEIREKKKIKK